MNQFYKPKKIQNMNLLKELQEFLKYPKLQKMDPNTRLPEDPTQYNALSQSVLIAFLSGLYKATRNKENTEKIEAQLSGQNLLDTIFEKQDEVIASIAGFAESTVEIVKGKLTEVADGYLQFMKQEVYAEERKSENYLQNLLSSERHNILACLPPDLKVGALLNDLAMEDDTNKMEGPISSVMHKIENLFSTTD